MTDEQFLQYIKTLKKDERVIETGQSGMIGRVGEIYFSEDPKYKGSVCVMWDAVPHQDPPGRMGTSITYGTRRLSDVIAASRACEGITTEALKAGAIRELKMSAHMCQIVQKGDPTYGQIVKAEQHTAAAVKLAPLLPGEEQPVDPARIDPRKHLQELVRIDAHAAADRIAMAADPKPTGKPDHTVLIKQEIQFVPDVVRGQILRNLVEGQPPLFCDPATPPKPGTDVRFDGMLGEAVFGVVGKDGMVESEFLLGTLGYCHIRNAWAVETLINRKALEKVDFS